MPNLAQLNAMDRASFTRAVAPVFEHSSWIAERTWAKRPFASEKELHAALCATVGAAETGEQLSLIRAHPDLVTRTALTKESAGEQANAGLMALSDEDVRVFEEYNAKYRERFGFPFVLCARLNKKETILNAFPKRLAHSRAKEIETALDEICKIAAFRLHDLMQ